MRLATRILIIAGSLGMATVMPSCQTTDTAAAGSEAVMCDKCKTVWVKRAGHAGPAGKSGYTVFRDQKTMVCPDCESAVATFLATGKLQHRCSHCGGALTHCTRH